MTVVLDGGVLRGEDVVAVARGGAAVELAPAALGRLTEQRSRIETMIDSGRPVYGVSTGFGALANTYIAPEDRTELQRSLIRSHAAGLGDAVEVEVVRAMMLCRLRTLVSGVTGVRPATAQAYAALLNSGLTPVVHEFGSLGCSGDLAPLAHVALALIGEGSMLGADGGRVATGAALAAAGLTPVVLAEKEGLALINGTDGMTAMAVLALADLDDLATLADLTAALSIQALRGTDRVFAEDIQALRPHPGQADSAANLRALLAGSPIVADHLEDLSQVQDAYSLRCSPQVHGALRDTMAHAATVLDRELAAKIDNPSVLPDGRLESSGNFHGAPVAYACDFLAIPVADVASMSERRTDRLLDPARSFGLPPFLAFRPGVDSGLMIAQYTQAGLVAELQRAASPASVQSIPSSAMQEDHVSMGWHAARKLRRSVVGLRRVLAIELVAAARALQLRRPLEPSAPTAAIVEALAARGSVPGPDRVMSAELADAEAFAASGEWREILSRHVEHLA
jgi:histidine ammonia-lyase